MERLLRAGRAQERADRQHLRELTEHRPPDRPRKLLFFLLNECGLQRRREALSPELHRILRQISVINALWLPGKLRFAKVMPPESLIEDESLSHEQVVMKLVQYFVDNSHLNVISAGFKNEEGELMCVQTNACLAEVLTSGFAELHRLIGRRMFVFFLCNTMGFKRGIQVFGPYGPMRPKPDYDKIVSFSNRSFTMSFPSGYRGVVGYSGREVLSDMFGLEQDSKVPKGLRNAREVCEKIYENSVHCHFGAILEDFCPEVDIAEDTTNVEAAVPTGRVVQFVRAIVLRLLPDHVWGCVENRELILKRLQQFVCMEPHHELGMSKISHGIKLKPMHWLSGGGCDKTGLECRERRFQKFCRYLFALLVPRLIRFFFVVKDHPSESRFIYFRCQMWSELTEKFVKDYTEKYLFVEAVKRPESESAIYNDDENCEEDWGDFSDEPGPTTPLSSDESSQESDCEFDEECEVVTTAGTLGRMRVLPKKTGFRALCGMVPGADKEERLWEKTRTKFEVEPVANTLQQLRPRHLKLTVHAIPYKIARYRQQMISEHGGTLPTMYALKFDVSDCYDSLQQERILAVADRMLRDDKLYISRRVDVAPNHSRLVAGMYKRTHFRCSVKSLGKLPRMRGQVGMDTHGVVVMGKNDIMEIIREQMDEAKILSRGSIYSRLDGIFQGLKLSSTFTDIVYDDFLTNVLRLHRDKALALRLTDDFLIVSPELEYLKELKARLQTPDTESYNITINDSKTVLADCSVRQLEFCGLTLDLDSLSAYKTIQQHGDRLLSCVTASQLLRAGVTALGRRLNRSALSLQVHSLAEAERNATFAVTSVVRMIMLSLEKYGVIDEFTEHKFVYAFCYPALRQLKLRAKTSQGPKMNYKQVLTRAVAAALGN